MAKNASEFTLTIAASGARGQVIVHDTPAKRQRPAAATVARLERVVLTFNRAARPRHDRDGASCDEADVDMLSGGPRTARELAGLGRLQDDGECQSFSGSAVSDLTIGSGICRRRKLRRLKLSRRKTWTRAAGACVHWHCRRREARQRRQRAWEGVVAVRDNSVRKHKALEGEFLKDLG